MANSIEKTEVDSTLDRIFLEVTKAINDTKGKKPSLDDVDKTLAALFDAVNQAPKKGLNTKIPDFRSMLNKNSA